jgi:translation initiation factor IF-2
LPLVGTRWRMVEGKKEAEEAASLAKSELAAAAPRSAKPTPATAAGDTADGEPAEEILVRTLPIVIKTDVAGTGEAVMHEFEKIPQDPRLEVRIVLRGVGSIGEGDVKLVGGGPTPGVIVGFNVKVEREARDVAERLGVEIATFDIIYKLTEWLRETLEKRRPRQEIAVLSGAAKVLKFFSSQKGRVILGGRVEEGSLKYNQDVRIMRRDIELGRGTIVGLQSNKKEVKEVEAGNEFGAMIKTSAEPASGDRLEIYRMEMQ